MGAAYTDWPKAVIEKDEFTMLREVLVEWCFEHSVPLACDQAARKAKELFDWFEFGIRCKIEMAMIIRPL